MSDMVENGQLNCIATSKTISRIFPDYFNRFTLPEGAKEERICVYRACKTGKCDRESFIPSFEEKNFLYEVGDDPSDPGLYSLSTYEKAKDVKRFASLTNEFNEPYTIARGITEPKHGICQRTKERTGNKRSSHVDWWLYKDAVPYKEFSIIENFEKYLLELEHNENI